jgi:hypothetical protein
MVGVADFSLKLQSSLRRLAPLLDGITPISWIVLCHFMSNEDVCRQASGINLPSRIVVIDWR